MLSGQRKMGLLIVLKTPKRPAARVVAIGANASQAPLVAVILQMATNTLLRCVTKTLGGVAALAGHEAMLPG